MSSASRRNSERLSLGATGTANTSRFGFRMRVARRADGSSPRRYAVVDYHRWAASDLRAFAIAEVTLAPPLDFGEFGVANGFDSVFVNSDVLDHILIAHDDRGAAVNNRTHG